MPEKKNLHYMARKTTANIDIAAAGLDIETSAVCIAVLWFGLTNIYLAFSFYLVLLNFYWAAVRGWTNNEYPICTKPC